MFIEYNPNPNNSRVGDCVIRAIAKAENASWDKTYLDLCVYGLMCADLPISNIVWGRLLNDRNYQYISIPNTCPFCYRVKDFCKDNPNGTFVLGTGKHAICIIDGNYYDNWDSGDEVQVYTPTHYGGLNERKGRSSTCLFFEKKFKKFLKNY